MVSTKNTPTRKSSTKSQPLLPTPLEKFLKKLFLLMGVRITNKVFLKTKFQKPKEKEKRERNKKDYAKEEQNRYIKKRNVNQFMNFPP